MATRRDITREEWDAYDWHDVTTLGDSAPVYHRGLKKTARPDDGFMYELAPPRSGDTEQRWIRIQTTSPAPPPEG